MCAAPGTSEQTLRYLRSTYDFIYSQLRPLPTAASAQLLRLQHLTWLLRLLALELKVGSGVSRELLTGRHGQARGCGGGAEKNGRQDREASMVRSVVP